MGTVIDIARRLQRLEERNAELQRRRSKAWGLEDAAAQAALIERIEAIGSGRFLSPAEEFDPARDRLIERIEAIAARNAMWDASRGRR
jgi:hypothetical protein